ncbi:hypothetical protein [Niveispirillum sp. KHB5.9]|uniref:hypothetical protein n=1 Tax=Niveispirillum sp. KHB5.9 TaxID=3400269 RepID=UPI003A894338
MRRTLRCSRTADLLAWQAPSDAEVKFADPAVTKAASRYAQLCRAMSAVIVDARETKGLGRELIAQRMSEYLGEEYTESRLNADTAESKETHVINPLRLEAFCHAVQDWRVWSLFLEPSGLAVIERRYLPCIEVAILAEQAEELDARQKAARRRMQEAMR